MVYTVPVLGDNLIFTVESRFVDNDTGKLPNALDLSSKELAKRKLIVYDMSKESSDVPRSEDPKFFLSEKTGRGKLRPGWQRGTDVPVMCIYSVVRVQAKFWGPVRARAEQFVSKNVVDILQEIYRLTFIWIDYWHGKKMDDILENPLKEFPEISNVGSAPELSKGAMVSSRILGTGRRISGATAGAKSMSAASALVSRL